MLLSNAKKLRYFFPCLIWRFLHHFKLFAPKHPPIAFVSEKKDWAINMVGSNIASGLGEYQRDNFFVTVKPSQLVDNIVHFGSQYMWLSWGKHMSRSNRYVVSFFHGKPEDGEDVARHIDAFLCSVPNIDKIITSSSLVENRLLDWGVGSAKLERIPIGVDTKMFSPPTLVQRMVARSRFKIDKECVVVGSFQKDGIGWDSGMEPKLIKGPDTFVSVLSELKRRGIPVLALLTGPARGYVKHSLDKAGVPWRHLYVEKHKDLVPCYHALDFYFVTSREEGGPMGLMESMATGVPVVSTRVGMATDLIKHNETGALVGSNDPTIFSDVAENLIFSSSLSTMRNDALLRVKQVDWSVVAQEHWEKVYLPLISNDH